MHVEQFPKFYLHQHLFAFKKFYIETRLSNILKTTNVTKLSTVILGSYRVLQVTSRNYNANRNNM